MKILVKNYNVVWLYKEQVDAAGLRVDQDYTWRYTPAVSDWLSNELTPATVEFTFQDPKWATYFELKWGR